MAWFAKMTAGKLGQTFINGSLRWYRSGVGEDDVLFEEDGMGFPPEPIRRQLIEEGGGWEVIANESADKSVVVQVMRAALQIDLAAAAQLLKSLPGRIYTGTKVEADWLHAQLLEQSVMVEVRRVC